MGSGIGTIGLIRQRLATRWERYLLSMPKAPSAKPSGANDIEDLIKQLSAPR
jgi:hypothetical protein